MMTDEDRYAQMGMAALIPGMQFVLDRMQQELDALRAQLASAQNVGLSPKRLGRLPGKRSKSAWTNTNMSAEDRSIEMKRRQAVARAKREGKVAEPEVDVQRLHPRDPRSPRREGWLKKLRKGRKKAWDQMSPRAQKTRIAKMQAGKVAARVNGAAL